MILAATLLRVVPALVSVYFGARQEFGWAALWLASAVLADGVCGWLKKRLPPGDLRLQVHLEGLADFLAFGICPALFCFYLAPRPEVMLAILIFLAAGIFRIARFNCEGLIEGCYRGLPITYNGYIFPAAFFLLGSLHLERYQPAALGLLLVGVSGLMVSSRLRVKELG